MPNQLSNETSPYLLQHATNPVDWYPWCEEALSKAVELDQPIFLSIGYAACHWCHVMEHESFEDPEVARIMNENFINIKVDREERPDLDSIYMDAVVAMTGQGGWPMSVFLTPEGKPFFGGTYFPPTRRYNMPSFTEILLLIVQSWEKDRNAAEEAGEALTSRIQANVLEQGMQITLNEETLQRAIETIFRSYDRNNGGFGGAPKFPQAMTIEVLQRRFRRSNDHLAREMAEQTLSKMAAGGIHDQIGGGFSRYSVDASWIVPHFEKMLYDNAQLLRVYLHAWQISQEQKYLDVVETTIEFLSREMRDPAGGFYSSLDADSEGEEGKFYLWSVEEIREACPDEITAKVLIETYGVTESGNFEGNNVLQRIGPAEDLASSFEISLDSYFEYLKRGQECLYESRETRPRPGVDNKIVASWNGLTLQALAEAAAVTDRSDYLELAEKCALFALTELRDETHVLRSWRNGQRGKPGFLEDYAALGIGFLSLYQADHNLTWYQAALQCAQDILDRFIDPESGFYDTADDHEELISRPKNLQDSPSPCGNTLACTLLYNLVEFSGKSEYLEHAERMLASMQPHMVRYPTGFSGWLNLLDFAMGPRRQLAIIGQPGNDDFRALERVAYKRYEPNLVVAGGEPGIVVPELLYDRNQLENRATAYLCQSFSCQLPTVSPSDLEAQLEDEKNGKI